MEKKIKKTKKTLAEWLEESKMVSSKNIKKTSAEWLESNKCYRYKITSPDGWDRDNFVFSFKEQKISLREFLKRLNKSQFKEWLKFTRMVSPPLEAYEYESFNKRNIIPSKRDYGLLFE